VLHQCVDITNSGVVQLSVYVLHLLLSCSCYVRPLTLGVSRRSWFSLFSCTRLPGLYELGLDEVSQLSNEAVLAIAHHCPHLRRLSLARAAHVTYHALRALLESCAELQEVNCALATQITAVSLQHADPLWQDFLQKVARRGVKFLR
jgi:hypothetical protein